MLESFRLHWVSPWLPPLFVSTFLSLRCTSHLIKFYLHWHCKSSYFFFFFSFNVSSSSRSWNKTQENSLQPSLPIRYCIFNRIIQLPSNPFNALSNISLSASVLQLHIVNSKILDLEKNVHGKTR